MIDVEQFRLLVVRPVLLELGLHTTDAEELLLGTAAQESRLTYLQQLGNGPALGVYQMEPATHKDIWENYLSYKPELAADVVEFASRRSIEHAERINQIDFRVHARELVSNLAYATAMCRIHYLRQPGELPAGDDVPAMAHYWKRYYNTPAGRGTVDEFIDHYHQYVKNGGK